MIFDPTYFLFLTPALLLSLWATFKTKSAFKKYSRVPASRGLTGAQAAAEMLRRAGVDGVRIVATEGFLSDHYNPATRTLALSPAVHSQRSIAAIGVACHEAGHALQHAANYAPLWVRTALVPTASIGSSVGYLVMLLGLFLSSVNMVLIGAALFSAVLLFQIVTLPVEFNASRRAKRLAVEYGLVTDDERRGLAKVLNAAAMTYVAAAFSTLMTLLYFLFRAGVLGDRD
ncbi:MAG: zinc metallopeptidase [Acidobacteria bacterium]|nr:MAG: zinc metallopeptidase [Acidobacteriota bacterium]